MNIEQALLTISNFNRPGTKRTSTTAIACHYIGNAASTAINNRNWFESLKNGQGTKASCHYIIGLNGEILQLIPEDEISWCTNSANSYTISIEACHPDSTGKFNVATYNAYVELCADLCKRWGLDPLHGGLIRHYDVTKKCCPKWFVDQPTAWDQFKKDVATEMQPIKYEVGWQIDLNGWWYSPDGSGYHKSCWQVINGSKYYFNQDGYALRGWQLIDNKWYFFENVAGSPKECALYVSGVDGAQLVGVF